MKALIFDFDSTLVDTEQAILSATKDGMKFLGIPLIDAIPEHPFEACFGGDLIEHVNALAQRPVQDPHQIQTIYAAAKKLYDPVRYAQEMIPYEGIAEFLQDAKQQGFLLAVVSNSLQNTLEQLCEKFFPGCMNAIYGDRGEGRSKPDPIGIFTVLEELSLSPKDVLYIGDTLVDYETARAAGVAMVGAVWSKTNAARQLEESGHCPIVHHPKELWVVLNKN